MIEDENHPRMVKAHKDLLNKLKGVLGIYPKPLDRSLLDKMRGVINDHRTYWRHRGVDFPVLVALVVPRLGIIEWKRADLDLPSIRVSIVNFVRMNPAATMPEVVAAFRAAYPDLKPDDVLEKHDTATQANERAEARREQIKSEFDSE